MHGQFAVVIPLHPLTVTAPIRREHVYAIVGKITVYSNIAITRHASRSYIFQIVYIPATRESSPSEYKRAVVFL